MQNDIKTERLILHEMTAADWAEYVAHVTEADELFVQYGIEPDERLIEFIKEPTIGVFIVRSRSGIPARPSAISAFMRKRTTSSSTSSGSIATGITVRKRSGLS